MTTHASPSRRAHRPSKPCRPASSLALALFVLLAASSSWSPWSPKSMYASAFARSLPHRVVDHRAAGDEKERAVHHIAHGGGGGLVGGGGIFASAAAALPSASGAAPAGRASASTTALSSSMGAKVGDRDEDRACSSSSALQSSASADVDEIATAESSTNGASSTGGAAAAADGTEQFANRFSSEETSPITTENGAKLKSRVLADDAQFFKSGPDNRRYRCVELPTNNLRILLVSDPDTDVESAAMHVKTGHFADPTNRAGLAHFHEHMLFLGTSKYPGEDDYEGFLGRNGGSSNAYTDMEDTNYYFNVAPLDHDDDDDDEEEGDDMGANMDAPLATAAEEGEAEAAPTAEVGGEGATATTVSKALSGALDRFAQFFISPTFDPSMIERELKAVDSEYNNGKTSDAWRNYQLLKENANEDHPFHKFGCGNYKTLTDGGDINHDQGEECIGERGGGSLEASGGSNPREDLVQFWTDHYHAGKLKLCVLGKANLDDLQAEVEKIFADVRAAPEGYEDDKSRSERLYQEWLKEQGVEVQGKLTFPTEHVAHGQSGTSPAFGPPQLRKIREVVPIVESRNLRVSFACPPMDDPVLEESRPFRVLSHLLGHESPGSLHYLLNGEGLINGLSSGVGVDTSDFSLTTITVSLTPEGMRQRDRVLSLVFQYIKLVRDAVANDEHGIIEKYHEELRQISKTNFRFRENGDSTDFCSSAAELLHHYEPEKLLAGSALVGAYDARVAEAFLERMTPENALITILNSDLGKEDEATDEDSASCKTSTSAAPWHHEHWYGAKYREVEISDELISLWKNPPSIEESLFLPNLNEFIPSDFSLRCDDAANKAAEDPDTDYRKEVPKLLIDRPELRLWHKMDRTFRVPKTSIRLQLTSPAVYQSPRSITLNRLYQKVLNDDLNSYVYDASLAGCSYRVACVPSSFRISVTGYSEKLPHLLDVVTTRMQTLIEEMKEGPDARPALAQRFQKAHENLLRETKNFKLDSPYETGNYNSRMLIEDPVWHIERYLDEMEGEYAVKNPLSMKECAEVAEQCLFGPSKAVSLCMGNIDEDSALEVGNMITQHFLKARPLSEDENPRIRSLKLPTKEEAARIFGPEAAKRAIPCVYEAMAHSPSEENSSVELILQTGSDHELGYEGIAIQELIGHIAYNSAYSQLRTREQLGYIVSAFTRKMTGQSNSLCVLVQSSTALPAALEERCEAWIEQYRQELVDMPAKRIAMEATAVVAQLLERDTKLMDEISSRYGEILGTVTHTDVHQPAFDRLERLAKELIVDDEEVIEQLEIVTDGEGEPPKATKTAAELKQQVIDFFDKYFMPSSPERRAMSARVYSQKGKETFESHKGKPGVLSSYEDARRLKQFLAAFPTAPYWYNR